MKVGITGGIGSGKSTVCRLFAQRGVAVYDSDAAAKRLMQTDATVRERLVARFGAQTFGAGGSGDRPGEVRANAGVGASVPSGTLDRRYLAGVVFGDVTALADLNAIVHPAVTRDFEAWAEQQGDYVILESAILFEAGLADRVDTTVAVLAPRDLRIERVARRDGLSVDEVVRRMRSQLDDDALSRRADHVIVNIFEDDLEPAVTKLDRLFRQKAPKYD